MKTQVATAALLLSGLSSAVFAQDTPRPGKTFPLFAIDKKCVCVETRKETKTATATESNDGNLIYQTFWSRSNPKRRLLEVRIGRYVGREPVKWWNYGIAEEADFNGDGVPDFAWYGGDDTSEARYLFLSSGTGYNRVDVNKTLLAAWHRRFPQLSIDLQTDYPPAIPSIVLAHSSNGLMLLVQLTRTVFVEEKSKDVSNTYEFSIPESQFLR